MKTFKYVSIFAVAAVAALAAPTLSRADKVITITNLDWNGSTFNPDCWAPGTNCTITITVPGIAVHDNGNGWDVHGGLNAPQVFVNGETPMLGQTGGFVFPQGTILQIDAGEYPGVPALLVNLSGLVTDPQGNWNVTIPH